MDIFTLIYPFSPLSPSLWETARYRLKYCLKGPLNPPTITEIFDEKFHHSKYSKKENWTNARKNKQEKAGSQSPDTLHHYQLAHQTPNITTLACTVSQKSLTKNFIIQSMERKKIGQIQGRIRGDGWFAIPRYIMSSSICTPNMTFLACKVVEKSLTKKCYGITEGRTDVRTEGRTDVNQYTPHMTMSDKRLQCD